MFWADQWDTWEGPFSERHPQPFSTIVENCVGIGQAVGGGARAFLGRPDEPVLYRGCFFMNADWPGDCGAGYVGANHTSMPEFPDVIYDDCTLVSPDNALQTYSGESENCYTRVKLKDCRLIVLNFSQPCDRKFDQYHWNASPPSTGIIRCDAIGAKQLQIDLENTLLMGFGVFGSRADGDPLYNIMGKVQAYVQYEQPTPAGFERLGLWPVEALNWLVPPQQPTP